MEEKVLAVKKLLRCYARIYKGFYRGNYVKFTVNAAFLYYWDSQTFRRSENTWYIQPTEINDFLVTWSDLLHDMPSE